MSALSNIITTEAARLGWKNYQVEEVAYAYRQHWEDPNAMLIPKDGFAIVRELVVNQGMGAGLTDFVINVKSKTATITYTTAVMKCIQNNFGWADTSTWVSDVLSIHRHKIEIDYAWPAVHSSRTAHIIVVIVTPS